MKKILALFIAVLTLNTAIAEAKKCKQLCYEPVNISFMAPKAYWPVYPSQNNAPAYMLVPKSEIENLKSFFISIFEQGQLYPNAMTENQWTFESPAKSMGFSQTFAMSLLYGDQSNGEIKNRAIIHVIPSGENFKILMREESILAPGTRIERVIESQNAKNDSYDWLLKLSSLVLYVRNPELEAASINAK